VKKRKKAKKNKKSGKSKGDEDTVGNIAGTEAGGITQVISAFQVRLPNVSASDIDTVTFLDTPGHAAFKAMRQSGSNGADVIVLVVAADDGVSPQTIEIINMYKNIARAQPGSISMVVAMTKIDKPGIDINESLTRIENQLMEQEIFSERVATSSCEFDAVPIFPLSGITGDGVDHLIEGLILQSEVMDLRACKESRAEGIIIDAKVSVVKRRVPEYAKNGQLIYLGFIWKRWRKDWVWLPTASSVGAS
jgi:Translation initiation factor 2 (IF-2; GTPase)